MAEIDYLEDGKFTPVAQTTAWNFQQGAMLQHHPYLPDVIYYNVFKDGKYISYDTTENGGRQITMIPAEALLNF